MVVDEKKTNLVTELMQARLTAVFESGPERIAVLLRPDGSTLKIWGETKSWLIESFDGRRAQFVSSDDQRVERLLEPGSVVPGRGGPSGVDRLRKN